MPPSMPIFRLPFGDDTPESIEHKLGIEAQAALVASIYDRYHETRQPMQPGTVCRERQGMGFFKTTGVVFVYMRQIDLSQAWDKHMLEHFADVITENRIDAVVLSVNDEGRSMLSLHDSATLEAVDADMMHDMEVMRGLRIRAEGEVRSRRQ